MLANRHDPFFALNRASQQQAKTHAHPRDTSVPPKHRRAWGSRWLQENNCYARWLAQNRHQVAGFARFAPGSVSQVVSTTLRLHPSIQCSTYPHLSPLKVPFRENSTTYRSRDWRGKSCDPNLVNAETIKALHHLGCAPHIPTATQRVPLEKDKRKEEKESPTGRRRSNEIDEGPRSSARGDKEKAMRGNKASAEGHWRGKKRGGPS